MICLKENIVLNTENIMAAVDTVSDKYAEILGRRAVPKTRVRLVIEELLLNCRAVAGDGAECLVLLKKEFGSLRIELTTHGSEFDPSEKDDEFYEADGFSTMILQRFNLAPKYSHSSSEGGTNKVSLVLEKKPPKNLFLYYMLGAMALAIGLYYLLSAVCDASVLTVIGKITGPLFNKSVAVIAAIATPLVFFAVLTGILGLGDAKTFGKVGSKILTELLYTYLVAGALLGFFGAVFYYTGGSQGNSENVLGQIVTLVLDIVPGNLVEPFVTDNDLQVITFAIFCGFIFLLLKKKLPNTTKICYELSDFFNKAMTVACKLLPLIVFLGIFNMLVNDAFSGIGRIYKMILLFLACSALIILTLTVKSCITTKAPLKVVLKKMLPAFLITLATSSQVAAIPENMVTLKKKLGIDSDYVDFSLPLCVVTFMPCGAAFLGLTVLTACEIAGVSVSLAVLVKVVIVGVIVAIAAPPIPGSALAVLPICFAACGVPNDVYPIAIVIGTIVGYVLPAFNCYCLQQKILISGYKLGKVDTEALSRPVE